MRSSGKITTGLLVFLCIMACLLVLARKLQSQKRVSVFVHLCQENNFSQAGRMLESIPATEDNFEFLFWLGYLHYKGLGGVENDRELAIKFWSQAAVQGHQKAIRALKTLKSGRAFEPYGQRSGKRFISSDYDDGLDAYRLGNYKKAFDIWLPLATQGHREAQSRVGTLYAEGKGVERDMETAQYWWSMAAGTVAPHQIKDSFRTLTAEEIKERKAQMSSASPAPLSDSDDGQAQAQPAETEDHAAEYSDSGMKKTSAIGSLSSMKQTEKTQTAKVSGTEYKPWLNE